MLSLSVIWLIAAISDPGSPRGEADKEWLIEFTMSMMLIFIVIHSLAYLSISEVFGAVGELGSQNRETRVHHWATIILALVLLYPIILLLALIYDGYNPYS